MTSGKPGKGRLVVKNVSGMTGGKPGKGGLVVENMLRGREWYQGREMASSRNISK
jgi:hypothetical protein